MFWSSATTSSNIDQVLDEAGVTLQKILEQDEVLQELRAMNKKLVEFLSRPESLNGMIDLITTEPSPDTPLASQYKLPNVACEILTSDNSFIEKVTGDKLHLEKLFFFFRDKPIPINPLLASYVCRVLSEIITRKLDQNWYSYQLNLIQIMGYLQSEAGVLSWLLNHLDCSAVCEFFFKLMLNVEGQDMRNSLYDWLVDKERLILRIMEKMTRHELEEVHANVSRLVGDLLYAFQDEMINASQDRSTDCDPFLLALRSHETITTLLNTLFTPDAICEMSIMHGLDLVLSLLGVTRRSPRQSGRNDSLDENNEGIILSEAVKGELLARMPTLLNLLQSPVDPNPLPMSYGLLEKPVGLGRLAIAKFIAHLFTLNDDELNMGMIQSGVLSQLLELFWTNPWNNFLHRYVCKIMICIALSAQLSPGSAAYLLEMGVFKKILEVFENKELKCGFRGHLAKVASAWGESSTVETDGPNIIKDLMQKLEETDPEFHSKWDVFYSDTLENYFTSEKVLLAGVHPPASGILSSGAGVALPYGNNDTDTSFSTGSGAMQWMGFTTASDCRDSMMNVDFDTADSLLNLSIGGGCGDDSPSSKAKSMFEMFCNDKANSFDDDDDDDDDDDNRKKNSFDLSSPDSDSLEEEHNKWTDHVHSSATRGVNLEANLFNDSTEEKGHSNTTTALGGGGYDDDDIFSIPPSDQGMAKSPPISIPVGLGVDPWSNLEPSTSNPAAGGGVAGKGEEEDPWGNPDLLFNSAAASGALGEEQDIPDPLASFESNPPVVIDWAKFDKIVPKEIDPEYIPLGDGSSNIKNGEQPDDSDEWANFESAPFTPKKEDEEQVEKPDNEENNPSSDVVSKIIVEVEDGKEIVVGSIVDVVVDVVKVEDVVSEEDVQSPTAKDETKTVSSSQQQQQEVSATN